MCLDEFLVNGVIGVVEIQVSALVIHSCAGHPSDNACNDKTTFTFFRHDERFQYLVILRRQIQLVLLVIIEQSVTDNPVKAYPCPAPFGEVDERYSLINGKFRCGNVGHILPYGNGSSPDRHVAGDHYHVTAFGSLGSFHTYPPYHHGKTVTTLCSLHRDQCPGRIENEFPCAEESAGSSLSGSPPYLFRLSL